MLAYKFKALENFHQVVDILLTQRIYCPTPSELNDPLEGILSVGAPSEAENMSLEERLESAAKFWFAAENLLDKHRICSFSRTPNHPLMWSYYGNGHSGICLELDISEHEKDIVPVEYVHDLSIIDQSSIYSLLKYKLKQWEHEEELRVIFAPINEQKYIRAKICSVLMGGRLDSQYIRPLFEICRSQNYKVEIMSFNTSGQPTRFPLNLQGAW